MSQRRMTERQKEILSLLSGSDWYFEVGTQPYSAVDISYLINMGEKQVSPNAVRETLKLLVKKGLASVDRRKATVFTGLGEIERDLDHYWNVATKEEDEITAKAWSDGAEQRSTEALDRLFGAKPSTQQKLINVN